MISDYDTEAAVVAAFDTLDARRDLHDALKLFVHHGERTATHFARALEECDDDSLSREGQKMAELLASELEWSKSLLQLFEDHNRSVEAG